MIPHVPASMKHEHDELHAALAHATHAGGRTAAAAAEVARVLHPHFVKEEAFALPPLGLLSALASGKVEPGMEEALVMTDQFAAEYEHMLAEHRTITAALERLSDAATAESKPEVTHFAKALIAHAHIEEELAYPAALLVGRYLKAMLARGKHKAA